MNAKDKAKELFHKIFDNLFYELNIVDSSIHSAAKKCALIAVDELIKECWDHREIDLQAGYDYWISVKQEIEKL